MKTPEITLMPGSVYDGYRVLSATPIDDIFAVVYQIEHSASGAHILHVACHDTENAFSINFATPPPDDTGMPHILEHSVLAGSRKYPVREPFFEMIKMSMATFINAMTGFDCTYYPVCSNVRKDLFNLADVYFDAVFHPLLSLTTFQREAHHLAPVDPANPSGPLRIDGIVYSEMKGVFSDPESRLESVAIRELLPDTCYGLESGGDPAAIPGLQHEQLRRFHAERYRPGNALFCFYGDIPTEAYLDFLRPRLASFSRVQPNKPEKRQPAWHAPKTIHDSYPVEQDESIREKTYLALNWRAGNATDPHDMLALRTLSLILLGNEAAPLRKAIVAAKLGGDLVMSGLSAAGPEATFHIGITGSEPERLDAFRTVVFAALQQFADTPPDADAIAAAFQQSAYSFLEIDTMFPLSIVMNSVTAWLQGKDPLTFLALRRELAALKDECSMDPDVFGRLVRERLLDNQHRLDIVLSPDPAWQSRFDDAEEACLKKMTEGMDAAAKKRIVDEAVALDALNGRPNNPEELASLPQLAVTDIPSEPIAIPTTLATIDEGIPLLINDVFSNGVVYLSLDFDLSDLPVGLWADLPRHAEAINKLGTAGQDYTCTARRISASTGGIGVRHAFETHSDDPRCFRPALRVSLKMLDDGITPALELLWDLLFDIDPRDRNRMHDVLLQARTAYRTDFVQNGQATVRRHAARGLTPMHFLDECVRGLPQLALSERRMSEFDGAFDELSANIEAIRDLLPNRNRLTVSVTGSEHAVATIRATLAQWARQMDKTPIVTGAFPLEASAAGRREGLAAPVQIAHTALTMPAPHISHPDAPLLAIGAHLVQLDYILSEIRFRGNAYGAGFSYDPFAGVLAMSSFRDPHIARTLDVYNRAIDYVRSVSWSQTDIDRAIIGVAKHDARPVRPGEATNVALQRHLIGWTQAKRAARRKRLLEATPDDVRQALLTTLETHLGQAAFCVMASRAKIEAANGKLGTNPLTITSVLE